MWNRDYRGRDLGDRARDLADRAGDAVRRGMDRLRGDDRDRERWAGRERWERERYGLSRRDPGYRGMPRGRELGGDGPGYHGVTRGDYQAGMRGEGYSPVHYDRDFGYGAYGAIGDRGFESWGHARPRRGWTARGYDRDLTRGLSYDPRLSDQTWGRDLGRWRGWEGRGDRTPSGYERDWRERHERGGMTPEWRGRDRGPEGYRGYPGGVPDDPYYGADDFRGRYDTDFRDW